MKFIHLSDLHLGKRVNVLIDSCRMVVDFIASKYPGQIEEVKRLSA